MIIIIIIILIIVIITLRTTCERARGIGGRWGGSREPYPLSPLERHIADQEGFSGAWGGQLSSLQ